MAIASSTSAGFSTGGSFVMPSGSVIRLSSSLLFIWLLACVLFLAPQQAAAHNWLTSPARGNEAGENNGFNGFTTAPCPQGSLRRHAQVGPGQKFPVEWASGHGFGSHTYLVALKAEDELQMTKHTLELLDQYLAEAPSEALKYLTEHRAHHVSHQGPAEHEHFDQDVTSSFEWVPSMPETKGQRPSIFRNFGTYHVYSKKRSVTDLDTRARYKNSKWPWIISVSRFGMNYDFPEAADVALMEIPASEGPGDFIVQYLWSGYYDCVDVRVLDVQSTDIWGSPGPNIGYTRTDHCRFQDLPSQNITGFQVSGSGCRTVSRGGSIAPCTQQCDNDQNCQAVQVVPSKLNSLVLNAGVYSGKEHIHQSSTCAASTVSSEDTVLCYNVKPGSALVGMNYKISSDPEDPVFYSTCYNKASSWVFDQQCTDCESLQRPAGFRFRDQCISCSDMLANADPTILPFWDFTDDCHHCDTTQG